MRSGTCDIRGDASQWRGGIKGTSRQRCASTAWASGECAGGGRLGWTRAGFSACIEGPAAGGSTSGRARCRRHRGWAQALLPPSCLAPSPTCPQLPAAPGPAPPGASSLPPSPTEPLLSLLLQAMAVIQFFTLVVESILWNAHVVGDELDEETREHMRQREEYLSWKMTQMLQQLEQGTQEQSGFAWGALLFGALQQWQFWAVAGVLLLLFGLCWWLRKRSHEVDGSSDEESSSSNGEQDDQEEQEHEEEQEEEDREEEDSDYESNLGRILAKRIQWPVQNLAYRSQIVEHLAGNLLHVFQEHLTNSFFPVLQPAIKVGSTFEGWSPQEDDAVYCLLVPLKPPRGHAFHLELGNRGESPARNFHVRVELECTCRREQLAGEMLCFLHHPEEELRRDQDPSLLHTLCTGSYLDVQKTACWFQNFMRSSWALLALPHHYNMTVLPSSRSCKLQLKNTSRRTLFIEIVFGVQQGNSDIFVSSQNTEAIFNPSTTWPESYAVAEAKFFRHMARQVPHDSFHLRCLQACAHILVGTGFSTYTLKTVVMHLLTIIPLSGWRRRHFLWRMEDIMRYLGCCLEEERLDHFFFGNERVPEEIILPRDFQRAEPLNLFQHLVQDPAAHNEAMRQFDELQHQLIRLLFY
ncbi:inositol 1,4,5-trisphosphate receptor-interacting protein-like 1 isoform X2 [Accipiter gentilis]|nr:inositol 1,4,5-trisphosphate receptor-interacting protein-like 1 isoform X2 [Accipiter gentilis]XP_049684281.1 inositol 1,4,5-trisphosphate receptor-interacting protein-like 1 isoform X2 [Accipiter gentilis]XP_049684282.1 inositol 1,4,5-trisphosphate receptor-interacting protein-like 1 isoform X2 [Accipiter gentilis]